MSRPYVRFFTLALWIIAVSPGNVINPSAARALPMAPDQTGSELDFTTVVTGEFLEDGVRFSLTTYQVSNGFRIEVIHGVFENPSKAREYFSKTMSDAHVLRLVSRRDKKNKSGAVVGSRAQIVSDASENMKEIPAVLWTDGSHYYELLCGSVSTIEEMERRLQQP